MNWRCRHLIFFVVMFVGISGPSFAQEPSHKMSFDINGMDVVDVLKMLGTKMNINLVIDKNVGGRVTVFLKDVVPDDALAVILASSNLVMVKRGDILRVMTNQDYEEQKKIRRVGLRHIWPQDAMAALSQLKSASGRIIADEVGRALVLVDTDEKNDAMAALIASMDQPLATEAIPCNYADAAKIAEALKDVVTPGVGRIKCDTGANKVVVTDRADNFDKVRKTIASFDERTREVLIDARIVQVNLNDKSEMGIDWEYVLNKKVRAQGMFDQLLTSTGHVWTIGNLVPSSANDYRVIIEALQTQGKTRVLSRPRLTVTNNQSAKILVGSKQVYVTSSAVQGQTTTQTAEAVNFVDVGVQLSVTPVISANGFISMKIQPEVSSVTSTYKSADGNTIPIVETSTAQTTVLVKDGQTLVIAGLMKDEKSKTVHKIPVLGDIPFLGSLFRDKTEETNKTELAIFLTCRILRFEDSK